MTSGMRHAIPSIGATLAILLAGQAAFADTLELRPLSATVSSKDPNREVVLIPVKAVQKSDATDPGQPVLSPRFRVSSGKIALEVPDPLPPVDAQPRMTIVFLVDVSSSMAGSPIVAVLSGISEALSLLADGDRYAVLAFGDHVKVIQPLTRDRSKALRIGEQIKATASHTVLFDAVSQAALLLAEEGTPGARAIVVLSDGADHGSSIRDINGTLAYAVRDGIRIHTLGLATDGRGQLDVLERMSDRTGGLHFGPQAIGEIPGMYRSIQARLHPDQFVVTAVVPEELRDGAQHEIAIEMESEGMKTPAIAVEPEKKLTFTESPARIEARRVKEIADQKIVDDEQRRHQFQLYGGIGGGLALILAIVLIVLGVKKSRRKARTCRVCQTLKETPQEACPECARRDAQRQQEEAERLDRVKKEAIDEAAQNAMRQRTVLCRLVGQAGGGLSGRQFEVLDPVAILGRDPDGCQVVFPDGEASISRQQAQLYYMSGEWRLRNLSQKQSTFVNGRQIDDYPLRHGDQVRLGHVDFQFLAS